MRDNRGLLKIFRAKNSHGRKDDVEQLRHDGRHPAKMRRTRSSLHTERKLLLGDISAELRRVHLAVRREKQDIDFGLGAEFSIAIKVAWILGYIFGRGKLGGIDVHADHHLAAVAGGFPRALNQADMAGMEIAHRRHERDRRACGLPLPAEALHCLRGSNQFHFGNVEENPQRGKFLPSLGCGSVGEAATYKTPSKMFSLRSYGSAVSVRAQFVEGSCQAASQGCIPISDIRSIRRPAEIVHCGDPFFGYP